MRDVYEFGYGNYYPSSYLVSEVFRFMNSQSRSENLPVSMLDIGCGLGSNAAFTDVFNNLIYLGIDVSGAAIKRAERLHSHRYHSERLRFIQGDTLNFLNNAQVRKSDPGYKTERYTGSRILQKLWERTVANISREFSTTEHASKSKSFKVERNSMENEGGGGV